MPNIKYYKDSHFYHLTPMNNEGFDIPDELWQRYLKSRENWVWNPVPYCKYSSEILMLEREHKRLTKQTKRVKK